MWHTSEQVSWELYPPAVGTATAPGSSNHTAVNGYVSRAAGFSWSRVLVGSLAARASLVSADLGRWPAGWLGPWLCSAVPWPVGPALTSLGAQEAAWCTSSLKLLLVPMDSRRSRVSAHVG